MRTHARLTLSWVAVCVMLLAGSMTAIPPAATVHAAAGDPQQVSFRLEGCRNDGSITLPNGSGQFICPDTAYTTGNLGKGWNELDLVPGRITANAGNSAPTTQTYTVALAVDSFDAGHPGYDVLSAPTLNTARSSSSCAAATIGGQLSLNPGIGGIDTSLYRLVTITQAANTSCVYDFYARLALGSHLFPGSSLHFNLADEALGTSGIGARDVSIPVNEILPQAINKDMTASQGTDHVWNITKSPAPAHLSFTNTCDSITGALSAGVSVTVSWTRQAATPDGPITVVTHVYATNPASRTVTVDVNDVVYEGTGQTNQLDSKSTGPIDVPANKTMLILDWTTTLASGPDDLNDVATATYTDKVTGIPVPGNTNATASAPVQLNGPELNSSAAVNDVQSISGSNLSYSVDSFSGATGAFDGGYVAGTKTKSSVSWTSTSQSGGGSVTFAETVYVDQPAITSGTLSDVATLAGSDGFSAQPATASVDVDTDARVGLTIDKNIPNVLTGAETASFDFQVSGPGRYSKTVTIPFAAGDTHRSALLIGLAPGSYTVHEVADPNGKWNLQTDQSKTITLPSCAGGVTFTNTLNPASARVRKVTVPAGNEAGWQFKLVGPGTPAGGEPVTTTDAGFVNFNTVLQEGGYTVTETGGPTPGGFDQTGSSLECSFTVNYPADANRVFSCTITNTQRGKIIVRKVTDPNPDLTSASFAFSTSYSAGFFLKNGDANDSGWLKPGGYSVAEAPTSGWDLAGATCDNGNNPASITLGAGQIITCTFTNRQRGKVQVVKTVLGQPLSGTQAYTFQLRQGANPSYPNGDGTILEQGVASVANAGTISFSTLLVPGNTYQLCEVIMPGWTTSLTGAFVPNSVGNPLPDNSVLCMNFTVSAGETRIIRVDNTPPPGGRALTIGFWKNWASCGNSNGKGQKPVLDQTLALAEPNGIALGLLTLHGSLLNPNVAPDCAPAVSILNKADIKTGKKMASDPAYNMAAQLLGARLNVTAGAGVCSSAVSAMSDGQSLLAAVSFNGTGAYAKTMTAAQSSQANSLATALDRYNNDLLC